MSSIALAALFLALGGIIKGATGAGAPVLAIPAMVLLYDVKLAVVIMMVPNLFTNLWQFWQHRASLMPTRFVMSFSLAGAVGAVLGTWFLATLPQTALSLTVAASVFAYVIFRLLRSQWVLPYATALKICIPIGIVAGTLQGATGISAPVSLSFFNAMRLDRLVFLASISVYFIVMTLVQIPALMYLDIMKSHHFYIGLLAMIPLLVFMPVGQRLARRFSKETFDHAMLLMLFCLAVKLVYDSWPLIGLTAVIR